MSDTESYDVVVVGSGEAGKYLAWSTAAEGRKTVVVERRYVGGSCPNIACLPSKNVIYSAKVISLLRRGGEFGFDAGPARVDMAGVHRRKTAMVDSLVDMHLGRYAASGAELVLGSATFVAPKTIEVALNDGTTRAIRGERVYLNLGSRATLPDVPGLAEARPMTHVEALDLERLPEHLVVLGGGYVGLELAHAVRRLGARVTVVSRHERLLPEGDADVSTALLELFHDDDIDVVLGAEIDRVGGLSGDAVSISLRTTGGSRAFDATDMLVALGRTPNTDGIGLDVAGVELTELGHVRVDERLATTAPGVWALGDCAGSPYFTHASYDDFRVVRSGLDGGDRTTRGRVIPSCLFVDPPLARVGLDETEARALGVPVRVATLPAAAVLKTRTISEPRGFVKVLVDRDDAVVGFTAFCAEAGELMATAQVAVVARLTIGQLREVVFAHPTMSEAFTFLFAKVPDA